MVLQNTLQTAAYFSNFMYFGAFKYHCEKASPYAGFKLIGVTCIYG